MEGSRFGKEPFDWHDQRFATQERIMALQFGQVDRRLERIEALIEGLDANNDGVQETAGIADENTIPE